MMCEKCVSPHNPKTFSENVLMLDNVNIVICLITF